MKSNWGRFLAVAAIGLILGAAFALLYSKNGVLPTAGQEAAVSAPAPAPAAPAPDPSQSAAVAEPPSTMSAQPVLEGVPPMPVASVGETVVTDLPVAGVAVGGAFSLVDHTGAAVTEKSWPGKYKIVFFGFTNCPDTCPTTLQKLSLVMENIDAKGEKLVPLLITVDPARDTKDVMTAYIAKFSAHIVGLTGTQEQIEHAIAAYKVFAARVPDAHEYTMEGEHHASNDYMVDHSSYVYLMSPDGILLETFSASDSAETMIAGIKTHIVK